LNEVNEEIKRVDFRDKVKHNERRNQLFHYRGWCRWPSKGNDEWRASTSPARSPWPYTGQVRRSRSKFTDKM